MIEIICATIAGVASIITAMVGIGVRQINKRSDRNAKLRQKESLLSLRMMDATLQLSVVTANALTGGHNNGNVERAREAAKKVAEEYEQFLREIAAHEVGK